MNRPATTHYQPSMHFLAFVDALGFSKHLSGTGSDSAFDFFNLVEEIRAEWKERQKKSGLKVALIGDSVIIASQCGEDRDSWAEKLFHLCYASGELQSQFAYSNIWTRGAVTCDLLDFQPENNRIAGPAFHRAYFLEKSVAIYPRIIIDGRLIENLDRSTSESFVGLVNGKGAHVLYNYWDRKAVDPILKDVPTFVDFARVAPSGKSTQAFIQKITEHLLVRAREDVAHFSKYQWLAKYILRHIEVSAQASNSDGYGDWSGLNECREKLRCI